MDKITKPAEVSGAPAQNGVFVRGIVVSNKAKAIKRKDGSGTSIVVEHEIALQPGVVVWQRYFDPKTEASVRLEGETVTEYPKLKEFQTVTLRVSRIRSDERTGQLMVKGGELLP